MKAAGQWLIAVVAISLVTTGCVDERSFYIVGNFSQCMQSGLEIKGSTDISLTFGVLDISPQGGQHGYMFYPKVKNDLLKSVAVDDQPERNVLTLKSFQVDLDLGQLGKNNPGIPSQLLSFNSPVAATIEPGGVGYILGVKIVPNGLIPFLKNLPSGKREQIVARIRAVADHNGATLKSTPFDYSIEVCNGCLVKDLGACPTMEIKGIVPVNACGLAQDSLVTCCRDDAAGRQICLTPKDLDALKGK